MRRFKNILAVETGAPMTAAVIERAADLARRNGGALTVLSVVDGMPTYLRSFLGTGRASLLETALEDERRAHLRRLATAVADERLFPSIGVARGTAFLEVIRQVSRHGHDLVVVSAEAGRSWFGSDVTHLLRKCPCPVWVLRPDWPDADRRVLVPVALDAADRETSSPLDVKLLEIGASLARLQQAELHVVNVWSLYGESLIRSRGVVDDLARAIDATAAEHRHRMDDLLSVVDLEGLAMTPHLLRGKPADRIADLAGELDVDMIVMGTVGRSGLGGLIIGNIAEDVLARVARPVLAVKPAGFESPVAAGDGPAVAFEPVEGHRRVSETGGDR